ncbi:MAG: recombinase family protein, partial [Oscillospiraceae bacterium]|nr:recombinase family protein [Oscillospiraceae bacterium]
MENLALAQTEERWLLLYRNSTKQQAEKKIDSRGNVELDIPNQRALVRPWAEKQGRVVDEVVEGGVSGYKKLSSDRDAVDKIKEMADRRKFDVLGIYMSERLGRIADDTPHIVKYLNDRGIRVISYREGEISVRTHVDKLKTYITYWQAEGESLKTSQRVTDAGEKNVEQGKWRGGRPPYGYCSVSRGRLNFKGRPIFDMEIDPVKAEVVKAVFRMYTKENYGTVTIAKYLNNKDIAPAEGCQWSASRIRKILKNKIYAGIYELGRTKKSRKLIASPVMGNMVIITIEEYNAAQELLKKNDPNPGRVRPTRRGSLLLTGLLYCDCARKFTSVYFKRTEQRQDGSTWYYDRHAYRCT